MAADWLSDYAAQKAKEDAEDWRKHQQKEDLAGLGWLGLRKVESVLGSAIDGLFGWLDKGINTAWDGAGELIERGINWLQGQGFRTGLEIATQAALQELHRMGVEEATKAAVAEFGKQQMQDVLDKFYKDSRETTDAKINALKQAGYDTTQLEAEVQKRRQAIEEDNEKKFQNHDSLNTNYKTEEDNFIVKGMKWIKSLFESKSYGMGITVNDITEEQLKEIILSETKLLNQGGKTLVQEIINATGMKEEDAKVSAQKACLIASLYNMLKASGAEVGKFSDFYKEVVTNNWVDEKNAYVKNIPAIAEHYGRNLKIVYNEEEFQKLMQNGGMIKKSKIVAVVAVSCS